METLSYSGFQKYMQLNCLTLMTQPSDQVITPETLPVTQKSNLSARTNFQLWAIQNLKPSALAISLSMI